MLKEAIKKAFILKKSLNIVQLRLMVVFKCLFEVYALDVYQRKAYYSKPFVSCVF